MPRLMGLPNRNICITANTTWYLYNFRGRLISELVKGGFRVNALSPSDDYVGRIESLGACHIPLEIENAGTNPLREVVAILRIANTLRRLRPAVLLTYTPKVTIYVSLVARVLRIPVIANVSGLGHAFTAGGWLERVARSLYKVALQHPSVVIFQNEEDRSEFAEAGLVRIERTARLPGSGVDIDRFRPRPQSQSDSRFVFLLSARMLWEKGIGQFVEAARQVKERFPFAQFWLLGFSDVRNPSAIPKVVIEGWASSGIVRYLGATDEVVQVYAQSDCVVLPSYYREGVPRSLLEASSMAIPVIAADSIGCRDAVEHGVTGFLCRPRDAEDLAASMLQMLSLSREQRSTMGQAGRQKMVREFDERIVIKHYLAEINRCLT
jgi:glycosyltransferase involved in cell wall biosynthesis